MARAYVLHAMLWLCVTANNFITDTWDRGQIKMFTFFGRKDSSKKSVPEKELDGFVIVGEQKAITFRFWIICTRMNILKSGVKISLVTVTQRHHKESLGNLCILQSAFLVRVIRIGSIWRHGWSPFCVSKRTLQSLFQYLEFHFSYISDDRLYNAQRHSKRKCLFSFSRRRLRG